MKMKDSGVEWIGEIPEDWTVQKVKHQFDRKKGKPETEDYEILKLARSGIQIRDISSGDGQIAADYSGYNPVEPLDILINPMDLISGDNSNISEVSGVISQAYINLRFRTSINPYFYNYYFKLQYWLGAFFTHGKGVSFDNRWTINDETLRNFPLIVPSLNEQNKIVKFLDSKLSLIDQIIADTKRSIEELKAYKQSLITETVTKGLDPNIPMKDSGVEWIGEIPESWKLTKNKYLCDFNKGLSITKENLRESGVPVISYGQVHSKYPVHFDPTKDILPFVSEDYLDYKNARLKKGDFIFADTSEDYAGSGNFSMLTSNAQVLAGYHLIVVRLNKGKERLIPEYLAYYFASDMHRNQVRINVSGIKVFSITQQLLKNTLILIPPYEVQKDIVKFLEEKLLLIDELILNKYYLINEHEIYKKSLIYEYVTGKKTL
ncbi:restriction endonuclease subunit S [Lactococcus petauri]|uniref:restriction endonuclease subunit S n=1 Tax=Lactococcus petauri TaxID=1940789 RepID=UPI0031FEB154